MNEAEFWEKLFNGIVEREHSILVRNDASFDKLMVKLENAGYKWMEGQPPTQYNPWTETGEVGDRGLRVTRGGKILCGSNISMVRYSIDNAPLNPRIEVEIV